MEIKEPQYSYNELVEKIKIDKLNLENELMAQPQIYFMVAEGCAEAISFRDQAKNVLVQMEADLSLNFRATAMEKLTEARLEAMINSEPAYRQQVEMHNEYNLQANKWLALRGAFEQRAPMLRDLVELYKMSYFNNGLSNSSIESEYAAARKRSS